MRKSSLFVLLFMLPLLGLSQYRWEVGGSIGAANYLGEIGGLEKDRQDFLLDLKVIKTRSLVSLYARNRFRKGLAYRTSFSWGVISGADSLSTNPGRRGRNLSFNNNILELALDGQWIFYHPNDIGRWFGQKVDMQAYVFGGVAGYHHNPKAIYQGTKYKLHDYQTEGVDYSLWGVAIPAGFGFNYTMGRQFRFGLELGYRTTFTDYLDDVSGLTVDPNSFTDPIGKALANRRDELPKDLTILEVGPSEYYSQTGIKRGNSDYRDGYMFLDLKIGYVMKGKNQFYKAKYSYLTGVGKRKHKKRRVRAKF